MAVFGVVAAVRGDIEREAKAEEWPAGVTAAALAAWDAEVRAAVDHSVRVMTLPGVGRFESEVRVVPVDPMESVRGRVARAEAHNEENVPFQVHSRDLLRVYAAEVAAGVSAPPASGDDFDEGEVA
jgi:hypothetical protein